ncbi:hypothetical protein BGX21_008304 [Mortierella sp. AD011]|nr:hypothetical protein BGX21_008304 [Mortierella sp. AD011]
MTVDDSVVQKLWKLTNELTAQLVFNRNATLELKQQLADLQAKHADISLRIANERLMEENSQLQEQLREYERWMEYIMTKFRLQNELAKQLQAENALLQSRLSDVGAVARKVVNEEYYNTESIIETLEIENQGLREMLGVATDSFGPMAMRHPGNRVSFPSTNSYVASSGSDREQQGHGSIASASPSEQAVKGSSTSMTASVHPAPRARKSTLDSSISIATNSGTSTASNSTATSPKQKTTQRLTVDPESAEATETRKPATARKKSDETMPAITNTKSGMSVNTSTVPKRNSSLTGTGNANASTSHASSSSTAQKTKKVNRKQKA